MGAQTRSFTYSSLSRLTSATNPESGTIGYAYDFNGNLATKTDARGITTTLTYDHQNRLTSKTYNDGTPTANYWYNLAGGSETVGTLRWVMSTASTAAYRGHMRRPFSDCFFAALLLWFTNAPGTVCATGGQTLMDQVTKTMLKVRSGGDVDARTEAAEHLAGLTRGLDRRRVTEELVTSLIALLDSPDDSVRFWVATALGNLGQSAKAAIPRLQKLLPEADCTNGALTSASAIRWALRRMGVTPPSPPNCQRIAG